MWPQREGQACVLGFSVRMYLQEEGWRKHLFPGWAHGAYAQGLLLEKPGAAEARGVERTPGCRLPPGPSPGQPSLSLPCSSGSTASGWRWWWTTGCPPRTGSCSSCTRQRAASSGVRCWRRPTPSKCPHPAPASLPPAPLHSGKDRNYSRTILENVLYYRRTTLDKTGLEIRGDNAHGYCHFSPNAQEHVTVLIVLALRTSTSLAGHVTFLSAKCSKDFLPNEQNSPLQRYENYGNLPRIHNILIRNGFPQPS